MAQLRLTNRQLLWLGGGTLLSIYLLKRWRERSLPVVDHVDLSRYMGTWYEIAAFPKPFERGCHASKAQYTLLPDGSVEVVNSCRRGSFTGKLSTVRGRAKVIDRKTNARLKVRIWFSRGDYQILALGPNYQWALVGEPSRRSLWILSRTPVMDNVLYRQICVRAQTLGFDVRRLRKTPQPSVGAFREPARRPHLVP